MEVHEYRKEPSAHKNRFLLDDDSKRVKIRQSAYMNLFTAKHRTTTVSSAEKTSTCRPQGKNRRVFLNPHPEDNHL